MNRKVWMGFVVVFILIEVLMFLIDGLILGGAYMSVRNVWRQDMNSKMWIYHVLNVVTSFFFSFIFSKGYENKGIWEGFRYGLYIGLWMSIPAAYATYAMIAIPNSLALEMLIFGVIEYVIAGFAIALVFKEGKTARAGV